MRRNVVLAVLVLALMLAVTIPAVAAPQSFTEQLVGGKWQAGPGNVQITATVEPIVELTLSDDILTPTLDPALPAPQFTLPVAVDTRANMLCNLIKSVVTDMDGAALPGGNAPVFTSDLASQMGIRGANSFTDNYEIAVDYDTAAGVYNAIVTYTLVQQ